MRSLTGVEGLPSNYADGAGDGSKRSKGTWDTENASRDLNFEENDDEALPGNCSKVHAVRVSLEDLVLFVAFRNCAIFDTRALFDRVDGLLGDGELLLCLGRHVGGLLLGDKEVMC